MKFIISTLFVFSLSQFAYPQTTLNVPAQYYTIQAALNAAQSGDTVLVQPGTYYENIIWPDENGIKLISAGDSANTIINGSGFSNVIKINTKIDSFTIIQGFKLTNGNLVHNGGGILINNSSPIIQNCWITGNKAVVGGGIYITSTDSFYTQLKETRIESNSTTSSGAGISVYGNESLLINYSIIKGNTSYSAGGGIEYIGNNLRIFNTIIDSNISLNTTGGGISLEQGTLYLSNDILKNNISNDDNGAGGGLYSGRTTNTIINNCKLINNFALFDGGGIFASGNIDLKNSLLLNNSADNFGGGLYSDNVKINLDKAIFYGNNAPSGSAIFLHHDKVIDTLENSQFINNVGEAIYNYGSNVYENIIIQNSDKNRVQLVGIYNSFGNPIILNSTIVNNIIGIKDNEGTLTISSSNIEGNDTGFLNLNASSVSMAINNWWGSENGPYNTNQNINGRGDSTLGLVRVRPFLITPDITAPPIPIGNVKIINLNKNSISLGWSSSKLTDLKGYKVYWDTDSIKYQYKNSINVGKDTICTINGLIPGDNYYFAVTCYDDSDNESWFSEQIEATTNTIPSTPILITPKNNSSFSDSTIGYFSWHHISNANSYLLQLSNNQTFDTLLIEVQNLKDTVYSYVEKLFPNTYYWHVRCQNDVGFSQWSETYSFKINNISNIHHVNTIPGRFILYQNYPNPFNPSTTIKYEIPKTSFVKIVVYNLLGEIAATLVNNIQNADYYSLEWNASTLSSGVYIYLIYSKPVDGSKEFRDVKKMVLLK